MHTKGRKACTKPLTMYLEGAEQRDPGHKEAGCWRGREPPHSIPTGASVKLLLFVYNRVRSFLNFRNKKINSNDQSSWRTNDLIQ